MLYASELETRLAKRVTKAITEHRLIEDGDRVMAGLSGGEDSWALLSILDVLRKRAPISCTLERLIAQFEVEHPDVTNSMIRALGNVAGGHLLDKRLNPLPELHEAALADGRSTAARAPRLT